MKDANTFQEAIFASSEFTRRARIEHITFSILLPSFVFALFRFKCYVVFSAQYTYCI